MDTIKFANGSVYNCSFLATMHNGESMQAFIALDGVPFPEVAQIFSNEYMTKEMEYGVYRLIGYTNLQSVNVQPYGIQAVLTGGHDEIIH